MKIVMNCLFAFLGLVLAYQAESLAHGGSHPTPWPTPPPPPPDTPGPVPTPVPTPGPSPTPGPTPTAPTPRPTGGGPQATPTGTPQGPPPSIEVKWKTWWEINKWRFTWTPQRGAVETSGEGEGGSTYLIDFLVKSLDHKYFDVRAAAALALGRAGSKAKDLAVPKLQAMTNDSNGTASESAVLALGMLKSAESVPLLVQIIENPGKTDRLRANAAVSLGLIGEASAARSMMDLIQKPKTDDQVKAGCMMGLALMKHEPAAVMLLSYMNNRGIDEDLRAMAATALGKMGFAEVRMGAKKAKVLDSLVQILSRETRDRKLQMSAIMAVSAIGPNETVPSEKLVEVLGKIYATERNADVRSFILIGIAELAREGKAQDKARMIFRNVLKAESNQSLLAFACLAAGLSDDRESINAVRHIFKSKSNPDIKSAAAVSLGLLKDVESTQMLLDQISGKGESELKGYCCVALGLMGAKDNKEALPQLRQILSNGNIPELRAAAAMALTLLGETNAVGTLQKVVEEGNSYIRMSIIVAIGYFRDMSSVPGLIKLFESDDSMNDEIRAIILTALGYIAEESEQPILKRLATHFNYHLDKFEALIQIIKLL